MLRSTIAYPPNPDTHCPIPTVLIAQNIFGCNRIVKLRVNLKKGFVNIEFYYTGFDIWL